LEPYVYVLMTRTLEMYDVIVIQLIPDFLSLKSNKVLTFCIPGSPTQEVSPIKGPQLCPESNTDRGNQRGLISFYIT
jgi:hypothetical protein